VSSQNIESIFTAKNNHMLRQTLSILCLLFSFFSLSAQDLHVYYNVFRDSVSYVQNGKSVENPTVKKGSQVLLHVENYNNYLYDVSVEVEKEEIPVASGNPANMFSQMGGTGGSPLNFLFKGVDQMMGSFSFFPQLSGADLREGSGFAKSEEDKVREAKVIRLKKLEADFIKEKGNLLALESDLNKMQDQVQQKLADQRLQTFAASEINSIRFNPRLEPNQIKRLSSEYMERIFREKDPNKIDLNQVLKIADTQTELPKTIQEYRKKADRYAISTGTCELLVAEFREFNFPESNLSEFQSTADAFLVAARTKTLSHRENAEMLESKLPELQNISLDPKKLSELRTTYIELYNNQFSKTYRHTATGEKLNLKLKLSPIDSLERQGMKTLELAPVAVSVYGGMRIRASVGLNFGNFFNRPQTFFVRDSVLRSSDKDAFVPVMTSFVHFYAPSRKAVSVAGSFGIGFPFGGGESPQSISFFLGPSLLFGKSERIVLNAGLMGGKVEQLAQGYKVGDYYNSDANLAPTDSVYELGFYLGVSFNLAGGGN
jgi:hypothetical protein